MIRVFWQTGVTKRQITFVFETIIKILKFAKIDKKIVVKRGGNISYFVVHRKNIKIKSKFFGYYDADKIIDDISSAQSSLKCGKHYSVFLMKDEIFLSTRNGKELLGGLALDGEAAIIKVGEDPLSNRYLQSKSFIYNLTLHEVGHVFGLPSDKRKKMIKLSSINKGRHCSNKHCVMYPEVQDNSVYEKFCLICLCELRDYFEEK